MDSANLLLHGKPPAWYGTAAGSVRPHLRVLCALGFCRTPRAATATPLQRHLQAARHALALCATSAYTLLQLAYAYQERGDMNKLSGVLFLFLCHVTCIAKQVALRINADTIDALVASLREPLLNSGEVPAAVQRREETTRSAVRLLRAYAGCAQATCVLWVLFALADRVGGSTVELAFWTGFNYDAPLAFAAVLTFSFCMTSLVAVGNTTTDAFVATVLHQCRTQFLNVREDFENLPERARSSAQLSGRNFETVFYESFVSCLVHYNKINELYARLEAALGAALLVQFAAGGWILCLAAYKILTLNVPSIEFASTTMFILCILTELLLFCYFGNEVAVQSSLVSGSLYSMEWQSLRAGSRRALLVAMTRAARPLRPAAGQLVPLTLETYLKILKSSYSFYAMLRQTKR